MVSSPKLSKNPLIGPLTDPWLITERYLQIIIAVATRDEFFSDVRERALAARDGQLLANTRSVDIRGNVAVIPVMGPLFRHASMLNQVSAATSYDQIASDMAAALAEPSVKSILMNIDSPGGEANGVGELADAIYAARAYKPVHAYVGGMAASAGYWIASAADSITCSATSELGSIGVRCAMVDSSKAEEAAGHKTIEFVSTQSPYKISDPKDAGDAARIQKRIDAIAQVFVEGVARNRGVSTAKVLTDFGKGDVFVGKEAINAGLADNIGNLEDTLSYLQGAGSMKSILSSLSMSATATENEAIIEVKKLQDERNTMLAAAGATSALEAVAVISGWKASAADASALKAKLAKQEQDAASAKFDSILDGAIKSGIIPPSPANERHSFALTLKGHADGAKALEGYLRAVGPSVPSASAPSREPSSAVGVIAMDSEEKAFCTKMGVNFDAFLKNKARRLSAGSQAPVDDDEEAGEAGR